MRNAPPFLFSNFGFHKATLLKRPTAILLVFLFMAVPLTVANAQNSTEAAPTSAPVVVVATPSTDTPAFPPLIKPVTESKLTLPSNTAPTNGTTPSEPLADAPPPVAPETSGTPFNEYQKQPTPYTLQAQPESVFGSLVYELPLVVPPGRLNMTPDLKLIYSSQSNDNVSPFEYGWSTNIPYIERVNKKGTDRMHNDFYFSSSMDGELYPNSASTSTESYGARNENGNFSKYEFKSLTYWLVTDKKGTIYKFGYASTTRQDDPNSASHVYRWMLEEARDANGNYIKYEYYKNTGALYPLKITYTGSGSTDGIFTVDFLRENRTQIATSSRAGFNVVSRYRINEIDAKINNTLARKYAISYSAADNSYRRLISSITETGQDESANQLSLPATTFTYQTSTSTGWTSTSAFAPPTSYNFVDSSNRDTGVRVVDVSGDALPDFLLADGVTTDTYLNLGNGHGYATTTHWHSPAAFVGGSAKTDAGVRILDVNGDGLADVLVGNPDLSLAGYINDGLEWVASSTWNPPFALVTKISAGVYKDSGKRIVDINGDGLPDILYGLTADPVATYLNNGHGWDASSTVLWESPVVFTGASAIDTGVRLVDINGDGLTDIVQADGVNPASYSTYINNGAGFTEDPGWHSPAAFLNATGQDTGARFADLNGDGLVDIIYGSEVTTAYINKGYGFTLSSSWSLPHVITDGVGTDVGVRMDDINGDSLPDMLYGPSGTLEAWINKNRPADLLITAVNNKGGQTDIAYQPSPFYNNGSVLNTHLPMVLQTVSKIKLNDGFGLVSLLSWIFEGGKYFFYNPFDRRPSGFATTTKTDISGAYQKTYFHQGDASNSVVGEYSDNQSKIGKVYRIENYDSSGNLYSKTINKWDKADLGFSRNFVKLAQSVSFDYDGDADRKDKAESYVYDSTYGNLASKVTWGEVTGSDDGTFTDTASDRGNEYFAYATNTANYVVGLPYIDSLFDQSGNKVRENRFYFDSLALSSIASGTMTSEDFWKFSSSYNTIQKAYNSYGLVTTDTNARSKTTTYVYDNYNLYPATTTNAISKKTESYYDYSSGKVKKSVDMNNSIFQTTFDAFDRPLTLLQPDRFASTTATTSHAYVYTDTFPTSVKQTDYLTATTSVETYTYFDGLARKIQERTEDEAANTFDITDTVYSTRGLVDKVSLPYTGTGSSRTSATGDTTLYTTYTYDPLERVSTAADALGTTNYAYDQWQTTVTDPLSNQKTFTKDAYTNLTQVDEIATTTYSTSYTWNLNNKLTKITDALGNYRTISYNGQGWRVDVQDLHASADTSTFGTWHYAYDSNGDVASVTDPKGTVISYIYDNIDRVSTEDSSTGTGVEVTYTYDACANGVGLLCKVYSLQATSTYMYDSLGRVRSEGKVIGTSVGTTTYDNDNLGNPLFITYRDGATAKYEYNAAGLVEKVSRKEATDPSYTTVVSNFNYAPTRQPSSITYSNGDGETYTFDATKRYRLTNKTATSSSNVKLQDLTYTYDAVGNITRIVDASQTATAKTTDFIYDKLYRLTIASTTNATTSPDYRITYGYTAVGNIASSSLLGTYSYQGNLSNSYANPHAVTTIASTTYAYDSNGNLASTSASLTNTWDYNNRLTQEVVGATTTTYLYDHQGSRVKYGNGSTTTYYFNKFYNVTGATTVKNIYAGDRLIATIKNPSTPVVNYVHADHLGSPTILTNASSTIVETTDYNPYGSVRFDTNSTNANSQRKYIDQIYDQDTSLSYLNARYYEGSRGQFLSEDPTHLAIGSDKEIRAITGGDLQLYLMDPHQLNSYSYGRNNPLRYSDPEGRYYDVSFSATFSPLPEMPGPSLGVGVRFDSKGVVGYAAPGIGWGYGGKAFSVSYTSGDIPRDQKPTSVAGTDLGLLGWSSNIQSNGAYGPITTNYSIGLGLDVYVRKEYFINLFGGGVSSGAKTPSYYNSSSFATSFNQAIQSQTTVSSRLNIVSSLNTAMSATTPQNQLWVTPSGAVVTWGGQLISGPPSKTK